MAHIYSKTFNLMLYSLLLKILVVMLEPCTTQNVRPMYLLLISVKMTEKETINEAVATVSSVCV